MKLIIATLLLASCTKEIREIRYSPTPVESDAVAIRDSENAQVHLEAILKQERPNIAFAKLIARTVKTNTLTVEELAELLTKSEIEDLIIRTKRSNQIVSQHFLYRQKNYKTDQVVRDGAVGSDLASTFSFEEQLSYNTFNYLRSKSLDAIIESYNTQSEKLLQGLVPVVINELVVHDPRAVAEIEQALQTERAEQVIKKIHEALNGLEMVSRTLGESNLSSGDKAVLAANAVLAAAVYNQVKDTKEFKRALEIITNIQREYNEFRSKYNEFTALAGTLNSNLEDMGKNLRSAGTNLTEAGTALKDLATSGTRSASGAEGVHSRRLVNFVNTQIRGKGNTSATSLGDQYRLKAQQVSEKLSASFTAADNAGKSLNSIIVTTQRMSQLIGVKIPKDVQKAMETAQKVISVVSLGKSVMDAYTTGGVMTALNVMGGSSVLSGDPNEARFNQVNQKLDQVLANQKLMLEAQLETMNMIKELSIMVDRYHEREMAALAELRDYSLIQLEIQKSMLVNNDIKSCEQIINYQLSSVWPQLNYHKEPYHSISHISLLESKVFERVKSLGDIRRMIFSSGENQLRDCHKAFSRAFGTRFDSENPLLAIFDTTETNNLMSFKRNVYQPALDLLKLQAPRGFSQAPLHLPAKSFKNIDHKSLYLLREDSAPSSFQYELDPLISVRNLERYVSSLVLLYPLVEIRESFWERDLETIVQEFLDSTGPSSLFRNRSTTLLTNALKLTQNALAQEAILAGEPTIPGTYSTMHRDLLSRTNCTSITQYEEGNKEAALICALRSNPLFMKNYITYAILTQIGDEELSQNRYLQALDDKNIAILSQYLDAGVEIIDRKINGKDRLAIKLSGLRVNGGNDVFIALPEKSDIEEKTLQYSENIPRLLLIQEVILRHLELTYPMTRDLDNKVFTQLLRAQ